MMGIILKILAVIGILLLVLLGLILTAVLLVLFVPLSYRASGSMDGEVRELKAGVRWLAGLLRVEFRYPEPGRLVVKLLWKTLYDSGRDGKGGDGDDSKEKGHGKRKDGGRKGRRKKEGGQAAGTPGGARGNSGTAEAPEGTRDGSEDDGKSGTAGTRAALSGSSGREAVRSEGTGAAAGGPAGADGGIPGTAAPSEEAGTTGTGTPEAGADGSEETGAESTGSGASLPQKLLDRMKKIWYTIRDKYDKIKKTWENISYYAGLLREEDTMALWGHVKKRLWKILKSIRPKHVRADILFGAGSPDATGYAFAAYGMLSPYLGTKVCLTPDFTQAILKGTFAVSGRITVFVILWNALTVAFDKKLHLFVKRMKAGRKKDG